MLIHRYRCREQEVHRNHARFIPKGFGNTVYTSVFFKSGRYIPKRSGNMKKRINQMEYPNVIGKLGLLNDDLPQPLNHP